MIIENREKRQLMVQVDPKGNGTDLTIEPGLNTIDNETWKRAMKVKFVSKRVQTRKLVVVTETKVTTVPKAGQDF